MCSKVLMLNDVARACFEAPAIRDICVEIPKEDLTPEDGRHDKVGHLRMSLYGTRDAAVNWQEEVAKALLVLGIPKEVYNPCLYHHKERNLRTFLHGHDLAAGGTRDGANWFRGCLEKRFEINTRVIGAPEEREKEWRRCRFPEGSGAHSQTWRTLD